MLRAGDGRPGHGRCEGNDKPYLIKRGLYLGTEMNTDLLEVELFDPSSKGRGLTRVSATTLAVALRYSLALKLGIVESELGFSVLKSGTGTSYRAVLYDQTMGGGGFVRMASDVLPELLKIARQRLECPRQCDGACHACLLSFDTRHSMQYLNRHEVLPFLSDAFLSSLSLPNDALVFGASTVIETQPILAALRHEIRQRNPKEVRLYISGDASDWDFPTWPLRRDVIAWGAQFPVKILVADGVNYDSLNPLISLSQSCDVRVMSIVDVGSTKFKVIAELEHSEGTIRWGADGSQTSHSLNEDWGTATSGSAFWVKAHDKRGLSELSGKIITSDMVARKSNTITVKILNEINGSTADFGEKFLRLMLDKSPGLRGRVGSVDLLKVSYSDRYICSPLHLRLLIELFKSIQLQLKAPGTTRFEVFTKELRERSSRSPHLFVHDWEDNERRVVFDELRRSKGIHVSMNTSLQHYRELRLEWQDRRTWSCILDMGLGYWTQAAPGGPSRAPRFCFGSPAEKQLEELVRTRVEIKPESVTPTLLHIQEVI